MASSHRRGAHRLPAAPPGRPERLRTEHLGDLRVPSLWLCGDHDPFGTPAELAAARALVAGPVTSVTLPGRHDLKGADDRIVAEIRDWLGRPRLGIGWAGTVRDWLGRAVSRVLKFAD